MRSFMPSGTSQTRAQFGLEFIKWQIEANDAIFDDWDHNDESPQAIYDLQRLDQQHRVLVLDYQRKPGRPYPERGPQ